MTDTANLLERAGRLLFGREWRAPFEDHFGLSNRALRRMLKGEQDVPLGLIQDVEIALRDHGWALDALLEEIGEVDGLPLTAEERQAKLDGVKF